MVGRLPFLGERLIVKREAGRLLDIIDVKGRADEAASGGERE